MERVKLKIANPRKLGPGAAAMTSGSTVSSFEILMPFMAERIGGIPND